VERREEKVLKDPLSLPLRLLLMKAEEAQIFYLNVTSSVSLSLVVKMRNLDGGRKSVSASTASAPAESRVGIIII
jgi:hypothetical protein